MPWEKQEEIIATESEILDAFTCPICKNPDCVPPAYNPLSEVLWIGEQPGRDEINYGKPFVGPTGKLLKGELAYLGYSLYTFRMCNLWLHPAPKNKKAEHYNECFEHSVKIVLEEAKNRKFIVLVGSESVKFFTGQKVSEWNGLLVKSALLSNPYIMAMVQPATAFRKGCGEMRFALQRFAYYMEMINA